MAATNFTLLLTWPRTTLLITMDSFTHTPADLAMAPDRLHVADHGCNGDVPIVNRWLILRMTSRWRSMTNSTLTAMLR